MRPDLDVVAVRGTVHARLEALDGDVDALTHGDPLAAVAYAVVFEENGVAAPGALRRVRRAPRGVATLSACDDVAATVDVGVARTPQRDDGAPSTQTVDATPATPATTRS